MDTSTHRSRWTARQLLETSVLLLIFSALFTSCGRTSSPNPTARLNQIADDCIARVGDAVISRQTFEQEWRRGADVRNKEDLLQEMIRFESLLAKARAAGVDRDPEVMAAFNRMVVGRFQEDQLQGRGLDSISLSEAEIQAAYQNQIERFTTPQQVRLRVIYCKASAKATAEKREEARQRANTLWNQARETDDDGFRRLALQRSDDQATRYAGGDSGWINPKQPDSRWDPAVVRSVAALSTPGDFAPLLEYESGFYIVKLLDTRPKSVRPLEQVRDGIEHQLRMEKARQLRETFFKEMQTGLKIEINHAALEAVPQPVKHADAAAPSALPK
jgi:peptidyl-prolyl cis-trans isomerase C